MATDRRRKPDEKVIPFADSEFRKGNIAEKKESPTPFEDAAFRKPSLDAGSLLDRRQFEQNLIRYNIIGRLTDLEDNVSIVTNATTVIQQTITTPQTTCYWEKVGDDVWYIPGDVYCGYNLIVENLSNSANPTIKIINNSDTAYDPILQFAVGATPVVKFTMGVDDSDSDAFRIENTTSIGGNDYIRYLDGALTFQDSSAAPTFKLSQASDTARDAVHQLAVGATPSIKWTWGLDDSDSDKWKLANDSSLGSSTSDSFSWGTILYYTHGGGDCVVGVDLADFVTDSIYITGGAGSGDGQFNGPHQIAYDGTHLYVADTNNSRVQKFLASTGAFVSKTSYAFGHPWGCVYWNGFIYITTDQSKVFKFDANTMQYISEFGSVGSGNDNFSTPASLTTDGTYLYICDKGNNRVKKHTLSGTYVTKIGSTGSGNGQFSTPSGIATDRTNVYVCDYLNNRVQKLLCSTLAYVSQVAMPNRTGSGAGFPSSITLNGTYWYVGVNDDPPYNGYHIKYDIATDSFQAYYDCTILGIGDPDVVWGSIILKNEVSHGDLLVVHEDGSYFDIYPKTRFFDEVRLYEGALESGEYVGLRAPSDVTASYYLTLPATANAAKATPYADAGGILAWGQNVDTDGTPTFDHLHLSATSNQIVLQSAGVTGTITATPASSNKVWTLQNVTGTIYQTGGTDVAVADGGTGVSTFALNGVLFGNAANAIGVTAIGAEGQFLRVGANPFVPAWSTLTLPNTGTAYRLPVFSATNVMTELAAVGATGQYLAGNTGAIPSWANISAFEPALGNPGTTGWVLSSTDGGVRSWIAAGGGGTFLSLTDVDEPNYTGHAGHFVVVNGDEDALIFSASSVAAHDVLSVTHGDTLASAVSVGSMIFGNATPKWAELNAGTEGQILEMGATLPGWGRTITISDSAASGGSNGDIWLEY